LAEWARYIKKGYGGNIAGIARKAKEGRSLEPQIAAIFINSLFVLSVSYCAACSQQEHGNNNQKAKMIHSTKSCSDLV
jgi:hypothetical protein